MDALTQIKCACSAILVQLGHAQSAYEIGQAWINYISRFKFFLFSMTLASIIIIHIEILSLSFIIEH